MKEKFRKIRKTKWSWISAIVFVTAVLFTSCGKLSELDTQDNLQSVELISTEESTETGSQLQIHYLDVGQGDATLIECDGHFMLIDAGNNDKGTAVQSYLSKQGVSNLDYVIGTHPDADHIGGLDVIITKFDCKAVFLENEQKDTATYRDVLDAISYRGYQKTAPAVGEQYQLGDAVFTIVGPSTIGTESNDNSIALVLQYGQNKFYFEGDAGEKEEESILETGIDVSADVYKIGHHGSKTSTGEDMLAAVDPTYAVISVGENSYGHPSADVLTKLREKDISLFRTDEQGTLIATSDGKNISWNCSPTETWQAGEAVSDSTASERSYFDSKAKVSDEKNGDVVVHVTENGKKYHNAGCSYLDKSDIEISLSEAKEQGYEPCGVCHPPE